METQTEEESTVEEQVEQRVLEIARLLDGLEGEAREDLRDYATRLLREETESIRSPVEAPATARSGKFNALGMGIPVFLVGAVLLAVFPPVGLLLVGVSGVLLLWGVLAALVMASPGRRRR